MKNTNERLAAELLDGVNQAVEAAQNLAFRTGDDDFMLLGMMLKAAVTAKSRGDILDMMVAIAGVMEQKTMAGKDATAEVLEDIRFTPSRN